jgi:hypothetical protein
MVPYGLETRAGNGRPALSPRRDILQDLQTIPCAVCGAPAIAAPRLFLRQERHFDCPCTHEVGLCEEHAAALRAGLLPPHRVVFDWTQRFHDEIYEGTRLILKPQLTCLACNAPLSELSEEHAARLRCEACGAHNAIGTALGDRVAVRLLEH